MFSSNTQHLNRLLKRPISQIILLGTLAIVTLLFSYQTIQPAVAQPVAAVAQMDPEPALTFDFSPRTVAVDGISRWTYTLNNSGGITRTSIVLTDTLPANVVVATPAEPFTDCSGMVMAPEGGSEIVLRGGRLGINERCTVEVNVTSSTAGVHTNMVENFSSGPTTFTPLTVSQDFTVDAARARVGIDFSPTKLLPQQVSRLTYTIDSSGYTDANAKTSLNHRLPDQLIFADPVDVESNNCANPSPSPFEQRFNINVQPNSSSLSASNIFVSAGNICTISVNVMPLQPAIYEATTDNVIVYSIPSKNSGLAGAVLDARFEPFQKDFKDGPVRIGETTTIRYSIKNLNRHIPLTNITFTDDFDSALSGLAAVGLPQNDVCGSGSTLGGSGLLTLTGGNLAPKETCTFEVTIAVPNGAAYGSYPSTTSSLTGQHNNAPLTADPATDTLAVEPSPQISKRFVADAAQPGSTIDVEFTITNSHQTLTATNIAFNDNLSAFIEGTTPSILPSSGFCGAGSVMSFAFVNLASTLQMTGGTLGPNSSCTFTVTLNLQSVIQQGVYANTTSTFSAVIDGNTYFGLPASDSITIISPPTFKAEFTTNPVIPGEATEIIYTINHAGSDDVSPANGASNINFTHDLTQLGLTAIGLPVSDGCGTGSQLSGTTTVSFTGGILLGGSVCTMTVTVQVPATAPAGTFSLPTSAISADILGETLTGIASTPSLEFTTLTFSKRFIPETALPGEAIQLEYTITNGSPSHSATGIYFTDSLSTALSGLSSTSGNLTGICGNGSSLSGTTYITMVGGELAPGESCTFSINVNVPSGASNGVYNSVTSYLSAIVGGTPAAINPATASLQIDTTNRVRLEKAFSGTSNLPGSTNSLVYTITNLDPNYAAANLAFTDDLNAALNNLQANGLPTSNGCGAGSSMNGTTLLIFAGGSLPAGGSCTFTVTVNVPAGAETGTYPSVSSEITGQMNGATITGPSASSELTVGLLNASHQFDSDGAPNTTVPLTFMLTNPGAFETAEGVGFSSVLSETLAGLEVINLPQSDACGLGSQLSGSSTLSLDNGSLRRFGFCTFTVDVKLPKQVPLDSYEHTLEGLTQNGGFVSQPVTATLNIIRPEVELTADSPITEMMPGQPISYMLAVTNSGAGTATEIALPAINPAEFELTSVASGSIPFTSTTTSGITSLTADQIPAGDGTTMQINATVSPMLNSNQTITHTIAVTSVADVSAANNSQTLGFNLTVPKVNLNTNALTVIEEINESAIFTLTLDAPNPYAPVIVHYQTADGTANAPTDYTAVLTGSVTIPAGQSSAKLTIPIIDDTEIEDSETFMVSLVSSIGGQISGTLSAQVTISDTDVPGVNLASTVPVTTVLPGQPISYTLTLVNSGSGTATNIRLTDAPAADLMVTDILTNGTPITVTIANGQTTFAIDRLDPNESVSVQINGTVSNTLSSNRVISHTATVSSTNGVPINDGDETISFNLVVPKVRFDSKSQVVTVDEEAGTAVLTIVLDSVNPYAPVTVGYQTADRTATAGSDYTGVTGTLTIPASAVSNTVSIPILNDASLEQLESFNINIVETVGAAVAEPSTARVNIQDDIYNIYLPLAQNKYANGPDLVIEQLDFSDSSASLVIKNIGTRPVITPFWVDLIVNPTDPPVQVNDTAERLRADGLVWGVQGNVIPLGVGESLTLTVDGPYFRSDYSTVTGTIPAGTTIYAHVDSASANTNYGSVEESHEISGTAYNNILQTTTQVDFNMNNVANLSANSRSPKNSGPMPLRP